MTDTAHRNLAPTTPGTGKWQWESCTQEHLGCQQSKLLLLSDVCVRTFTAQYRQFSGFYLLLGEWESKLCDCKNLWIQLSQWLTGRFTTGLNLCFLGSKNNLLHLPLNSAQCAKYKYTGYIPTPQNGMVPLKWSATPTIHWKHTAPVFVTKDSSCAIPILTQLPKMPIYDTSTYFHVTFHFNFCIKSQALT